MLQLTFKQKLIVAVILTLTGVVYLGFVSLNSLNELSRSSLKVSNLTTTNNLLSSLQLDLLSVENQLSQLNHENNNSLKQQLIGMTNKYKQALSEAQSTTESSELTQKLGKTAQLFEAYKTALNTQAFAQETLGYDDQSGLLKPLAEAASALEEQLSTFSMLLQPFIVARQMEKEYLINPTSQGKERLLQQIDTVASEVKDAEFYDTFGPYIETYQGTIVQLTGAAEALSKNSIHLDQSRKSFREQSQSTQSFLEAELLQRARKEAAQATDSTQWTIIFVSVAVALAICVILATTALTATRTLQRIISQLKTIAAGNLTQSLPVSQNKPDEFDQVSGAVNTMTNDLRQVISQVVTNQTDLYSEAKELSDSVQTIASNNRTVSDQSNTLASATEEISATTEQVAHRVFNLKNDSQNAHTAAVEGGETIKQAMRSLSDTAGVVEQSSNQLRQLEQHSQEIDKVLIIINDLADQTNLLALNAAIEAARAGEAGRGFSVVADEVRTLAESTVKATGDITETVRAIQQQTHSVIKVMDQSTQSIEEVKLQGDRAQQAVENIENQTQQALWISEEITSAIEEVAKTTREMASSMDQIASGVEQNSCASTAIVASSDNLKNRAEKMGEMTKKFQH
ncbi:methyl-accepting chemotaxis protein [Neptuniibacter sp.]|uniref:methyl-accepting chemotaxis protein n=1 Tax=Neptuniibacter sp. TaxID=1962643 RepID=UPI002628FF3C|nr:methyl-accepting chemotaxis protein [Neptuniibacter sp.]MCP4595254.1 methyl-accepting chemotaxis protein [Neptuniibacter sp.]